MKKINSVIDKTCILRRNMKNSTIIILNHIAATTVHSILEVYDVYSSNMAKYNVILSESEILKCMELYGLYSIDDMIKIANAGN